MKKKRKIIEEPEFIGGLGPLTKEEEQAISEYFQKLKKAKSSKKAKVISISSKRKKAAA